MNLLRTTAVAALLLLGSACGGSDGDGGGGAASIFGNWAIASVTGGDPTDDYPVFDARSLWLRIEPDNTFAVLSQTQPNLFHDSREGVVTVTGTQVSFDGRLFNYAVAGTTLTLTRPDTTIVATLDANTPLTDDWVVPVVELLPPVDLAAAVEDGTDLAYDGAAFWVGNAYYGPTLQRLDASTGAVTGTQPCNQSAWGMAWDGTNFWVSSDGSDNAYRIDNGGVVVQTSPAMGAWLQGLAWDGVKLWAFSNNEQSLYSWTPGNAALDSSLALPDANAYNGGLEYANGYLYLTADHLIYKIQPAPFQVVRTYRYSDLSLTGIGYDGADFYLIGDANLGGGPAVLRIVRVALP